MKNALTEDQVARWLRSTAENLFDIVVALDSPNFRLTGIEAEREHESLERVVKQLEPCRTPAMPRIDSSGRRASLEPLKLTPQLLNEIGLPMENLSPLAGRLLLAEVPGKKRLSPGGQSLISQLAQQGAPSDLVERTRGVLAKLEAVRDYLRIRTA